MKPPKWDCNDDPILNGVGQNPDLGNCGLVALLAQMMPPLLRLLAITFLIVTLLQPDGNSDVLVET